MPPTPGGAHIPRPSRAVAELLPNAREHDPTDKVTTRSLAAGFVLMAATLVLLAYVDPGDPGAVA